MLPAAGLHGSLSLEARSALGAVHAPCIIPLAAVFAVYHLSYELQSIDRFLGKVAETHHLITRLRVQYFGGEERSPVDDHGRNYLEELGELSSPKQIPGDFSGYLALLRLN